MCPVGTCRRRWQSDPKVGSETSGGRGQRPPRRLSDRGREAPPNLPTAGAGAWPGGARGWVRRAAFLAPEGRSKRSRRAGGGAGPHPWRERWARGRACRGGRGRVRRGLCRAVRGRVVRRYAPPRAASRVSCAGRALETLTPCGGRGRAASMARAVGAGTRLPRREVACAAGFLRGGGFAGWCAGAWSGGMRRRVRRVAFLAPEGRSKRFFCLRRLRACGREAEKKGGRAGGRGPLYACRGTKKIFSVKEILFINEKKFFSGRGKDEESPPSRWGRRAEGSGGIRTRGVRRYRPAGRPP